MAEQVNALGSSDAVIHNVGIGYRDPRRIATEDGLPHVFAVNTFAPHIRTALIEKPQRLVYLSSSLHKSGDCTPGESRVAAASIAGARLASTPSCVMCSWLLRQHTSGRMFSPGLWSQAGW